MSDGVGSGIPGDEDAPGEAEEARSAAVGSDAQSAPDEPAQAAAVDDTPRREAPREETLPVGSVAETTVIEHVPAPSVPALPPPAPTLLPTFDAGSGESPAGAFG